MFGMHGFVLGEVTPCQGLDTIRYLVIPPTWLNSILMLLSLSKTSSLRMLSLALLASHDIYQMRE